MDRPQIFLQLNDIAKSGGDVYSALRDLPIDVVADLMFEIPSEFSALKSTVPRMAADEIQDHWTGNHGHTLLFQSCAFVHSIEAGFLKHTRKSLRDCTVLDYGCGWGRLLRLMYAFTPPSNLYGCDPWQRSITLCREAGISANLAACDYLPKRMPFDQKFDLIYAFSVFTHLSRNTADTVLAAMRKSIKPDGLVVLTVRPISYWWVHQGQIFIGAEKMQNLHRANEYAFIPHEAHGDGCLKDADGVLTYGDASFSVDFIRENWREWELVGQDINLLDPHQLIVFLKPRSIR
jgi:2-polyprenyl-3-methyl-5-hydroxy-6-metoxy-1,4-benzoquinol methylase